MNLTASQKRLIESDQRLRDMERNVSQSSSDQQSIIQYAVEYLRAHPEAAKKAGLSIVTPEDKQLLKSGFDDMHRMLSWLDEGVNPEDARWDTFDNEFPSHINPPKNGEPEHGAWARLSDIENTLRAIIDRI